MGFFLPAVIVIILDQLTKQLIWHNGRNYEIIDGLLRITLVKNAGAAFGLFQGGRVFFIAASVVAIVFIVYVAMRVPRDDWARRLFLGMILGGAIGNLIDRAYAGEVIDFIDMGIGVHRFPVYNVADMGVSIGATLLLIYLMRSHERHEAVEMPAVAPGESAAATPDDSPPRAD